MAKVQVKATHEFWAENDAELSFQQGDIITVLNKDDPGWWEGELNGQRGLFPSNYVEVLKPGAGGGPKPPGGAKPAGAAPPSSRQSANNVATKAPAKTAAPAKVTGAGVIKLGGGNTNGAANGARGAPPSARPPASSNAGPKPPSSAPSGPKPPSSPKNAPATRIQGEYKGGATGTDTVRVGASGGAKANVEKGKDSKTKIGLWASSMAYCTAFAGILFGLCGIPWGVEYQSRKDLDIFCAFYLIIVSVGIIAYEKYFGGNRNSRGAGRVPIRGLVLIALGIFPLYSEVTLIPAGFLFITGFVNIIACLIMAENYSEPPKQAKAAKESNQQEADGVLDSIVQYATMVKEQNKVGTLVFLALYVLANFVIFVTVLLEWNEKNRALAVQNRLSGYGPVAKAFGNLLDFNCSIIVLPVLRSFIRSLYNMSTADQGCFSKMLRFILLFVPLDRALEFHKLISKMIVFSVIGHTAMHFFNYSFRPTQTMNLFGIWPWYSGSFILFCMLMIYSGTRESVKRGQFEIFWYNHHFFIGFWALLLTHGNGGVQINFMKWFAGPGSLYLMERILRIYRANLPVVVLSVNIMRPCVFSLEFDKAGVFAQPYKEGQYIFINAPTVAFFEWHPFTISSAPEEKSVTVHIRTQGKGSWTERLMNKFEQMGPKQAYFRLNRAGPQGQIPGKILGPEGKPLLSIDGPHSAPTQHVGEYSVAMVVGAGIGVTPVGSVLKSVVFHKWKYYIGQCFPDHAYFLWVCGYQDLDAFRWLVRVLKDAQDEIVHMRYNNPENMATKTFQCHIWITSVPKDAKPVDVVVDDEAGFWGVPREDAKVEKVRANFAEEDMYRVMKCPGKHTQLGDIHIWNGRPEWEPRFEEVAKNHPKGDVGVTFCGNPIIAKDLAKNCHMASHGRKDGIFVLHKENF